MICKKFLDMSNIEEVKKVVGESLQLGERTNELTEATPLLGALPELDSMAVVTVITAIEDHFGIVVEDDDISAETFETLGSLSSFVQQKLEE